MLVQMKTLLLAIQVFAILGVVVESEKFDDCWNKHGGVCLVSVDCTDGFREYPRSGPHNELCPNWRTCCLPKVPTRVRDIEDENCGFSAPVHEGLSIFNGKVVGPEKFPWYVAIKYEGRHICGGSILNSQWILSAAHCFTNMTISNFAVVAGSRTSLETDEVHSLYYQTSAVEAIHMNNYIKKNSRNDIAMVKLSTPLTWTDGVRPVCLPPARSGRTMFNNVDDEVVFSAVGFGFTEKTWNPILLRAIHLPGVTLNNCALANRVKLASTQLCAGYPFGLKDTAQGDSGGPLTHVVKDQYNRERAELSGIVAVGFGIAQADRPGIYTRVSAYISWINNLMNE